MMNPLSLFALIAGGGSALSSLFGNKSNTTTQTTTEQPKGYQSPYLGYLDSTAFFNILNNLGTFSKFGMPGGTERFPFGQEIMKLAPSIFSKLTEEAAMSPELKACMDECDAFKAKIEANNAKYGDSDSPIAGGLADFWKNKLPEVYAKCQEKCRTVHGKTPTAPATIPAAASAPSQ